MESLDFSRGNVSENTEDDVEGSIGIDDVEMFQGRETFREKEPCILAPHLRRLESQLDEIWEFCGKSEKHNSLWGAQPF